MDSGFRRGDKLCDAHDLVKVKAAALRDGAARVPAVKERLYLVPAAYVLRDKVLVRPAAVERDADHGL